VCVCVLRMADEWAGVADSPSPMSSTHRWRRATCGNMSRYDPFPFRTGREMFERSSANPQSPPNSVSVPPAIVGGVNGTQPTCIGAAGECAVWVNVH
jgi:hypothetical protein